MQVSAGEEEAHSLLCWGKSASPRPAPTLAQPHLCLQWAGLPLHILVWPGLFITQLPRGALPLRHTHSWGEAEGLAIVTLQLYRSAFFRSQG